MGDWKHGDKKEWEMNSLEQEREEVAWMQWENYINLGRKVEKEDYYCAWMYKEVSRMLVWGK